MWITRWNNINARIRAFEATTRSYALFVQVVSADKEGVSNSHLIPEAKEILSLLTTFQSDFATIIPHTAKEAIQLYLNNNTNKFSKARGIEGVVLTSIVLSSIRASLEFLFAGIEAIGRSITERAFEHLQRSIVADKDHRKKWKAAFKAGETACESLGAVHLLLHGIWAFKINSVGERTDLVFGEPLQLGEAERTVPAALVLTEWKVARTADLIEQRFEEAKKQAKLYAGGSLSDLELSTIRFLVVVTNKERSNPPQDFSERNVTYRNKLLAVDPDSPSKESKSKEPHEK